MGFEPTKMADRQSAVLDHFPVIVIMVHPDGIEPPTRNFSNFRSTPELRVHHDNNLTVFCSPKWS